MRTWVLYVDESGDSNGHHIPIKNGETPILVLTGLALPLNMWRTYTRHYNKLKHDFFSKEINESNQSPSQWEIKGNKLCAPRNAQSRRNKIFLSEVLKLVKTYNGRVFSQIIFKNHISPTSKDSLYTMSIQWLAQSFEIFLQENDYQGVLVIDSRLKDKEDTNVSNSYLSFIFGNDYGKQISKIQETPLFADSKLTVGLQIVDNVSSAIFGSYYNSLCSDLSGAHNYEHVQNNYWDLLCEIKYISREPVNRMSFNNRIVHGYRLLNFYPTT